MMMLNTLGDDVKLKMWVMSTQCKMKQKDIAKACKLTQSTVSHWIGVVRLHLSINGIDEITQMKIDTIKKEILDANTKNTNAI